MLLLSIYLLMILPVSLGLTYLYKDSSWWNPWGEFIAYTQWGLLAICFINALSNVRL